MVQPTDPLVRPLILLSPHPDDLCYSLGALLSARDCRRDLALVAFTVSRYAPMNDKERGDQDAVTATRRAEDIGYWESLGVDRVDLALPDCTVRSPRWQDWFEVPCAPQTVAILSQAIRREVDRRPEAAVVVPLALGGHTDHAAVRQAALDTVPAARLIFFEDLPYAAELGPERVAGEVAAVNADAFPFLRPMDGALDSKLAAAARHYPSQLRSSDTLAIGRYANAVGGPTGPAERVWLCGQRA